MNMSVIVAPTKDVKPAIEEPETERYLHCAIFLEGRTLGDETFRLVRLQGQESLSEPFEFDLELHENTDFGPAPTFGVGELVGRAATIGIALPGKGADPELFKKALATKTAKDFQASYGDDLVLFNGVVAAAALDVQGVYHVTLKPALWKLTLTNRYAIHRSKSIREAIAGVLDDHHVEYSLKGVENSLADTRVQDWLQAGETDYDFVRRLMAKAHIYYYHLHCGSRHELKFANNVSYPRAWPVQNGDKPPREVHRVLRYQFNDGEALGLQQDDVVYQFAYKRSLVSSGVRSVFANQGAAWKQDPIANFGTFTAPAERTPTALPFNLYKVYQYGLSTPEVEDYTAQTERSLGSSGVQLSGSTSCARFHVAHTFKMDGTGHAEIDGQAFVLTQVQHEASLDGTYKNQFQATEASLLIAPFSVQETQQGNVLARVVPAPVGAGTPSGTKPDTWTWYRKDNFGYAQQQLTDRQSDPKQFDALGVFVEFATEAAQSRKRAVWIKLAPHLTAVPEIGTMVLVSRANDESELPEIQSIQANGSFTVTPSKWTANTHVGSNYSTSYGDTKSLRYGESSQSGAAKTLAPDAAAALLDTQYRTKKFREVGYAQGGTYSYAASEKGRDGMLSDSHAFGSTYNNHVAAETKSVSDVGTVYNESTAGTSESISTVNGLSKSTSTYNGAVDSTTTHNDKVTSTTTHNGDVTTTMTHETGDVTSTSTYKHKLTSTTTHGGEVISNTTHDANVSSTNTVNADSYAKNTTNGDAENVTKVTGTATNRSTHNIVHNFAATNMQSSSSWINANNSNEGVGISNSNRLIGESLDIHITGASFNLSATGMSLSVSKALSLNKVDSVLDQNSVDIVGGGLKFATQAALAHAEIIGPKISLLSAIRMIM